MDIDDNSSSWMLLFIWIDAESYTAEHFRYLEWKLSWVRDISCANAKPHIDAYEKLVFWF